MSRKVKVTSRSTRAVKAKSMKAKSIKTPAVAKGLAKMKIHGRHAGSTETVKIRTSLKGVNIYPASVEPSKRAKRIVTALAGRSFAA